MKNTLEEVGVMAGLYPNLRKCVVYAAGITEEDKNSLADQMGMSRGVLPVKYLGVPLISTTLLY